MARHQVAANLIAEFRRAFNIDDVAFLQVA